MSNERRDIYDSIARWETWKNTHAESIEGVSDFNSRLIINFLHDLELGKNISKNAVRGERSPIRLNAVASRMSFFGKHFKKKMNTLNKEDVHKLFADMKSGKILKSNGEKYKSIADYVKVLKSFAKWLIKVGKMKDDFSEDLSGKSEEKPAWVYLDEKQFKTLANHCNPEYKPLVWFMLDTGARVTESYSVKVSDFQKDFTMLTIRGETSKNSFERSIHLKLCTGLIKEYVEFHNLKNDDFLIQKKPATFNKYLRTLSNRIFGKGVSNPKARGTFDKLSLYDIRHIASCYWLNRYQNHSGLMYRMGWKSEKFIQYYSEMMGQTDKLSDEDMIIAEDKTKLSSIEETIKNMQKAILLLSTKKEKGGGYSFKTNMKQALEMGENVAELLK